MKEYVKEIIHAQSNPIAKKNLMREYLQARILESLQQSGAMISLAFLGDTALRFLYYIRRFSEDLDFSLERPDAGYNFRTYLRNINSQFLAEGYAVHIKLNDQKTVNSAFVKFPGLLYELNLSQQPGEVLSIKIEIDTHPPSGAVLEVDLVRRYIPLRIQHHDRALLLSGKLHAVLSRNYSKGRDLYDLMWYLSDPDWPEPNLFLLRNALEQTHWEYPMPETETWRDIVYQRIKSIDWESNNKDVYPFLERPNEIELLRLDTFKRLLHQ
jgi:hypothetical protein